MDEDSCPLWGEYNHTILQLEQWSLNVECLLLEAEIEGHDMTTHGNP